MKKAKREPKRRELKLKDLETILEQVKAALSPEDHATLSAAIDTLAFLTRELEAKGASIRRLRKLLFGSPTEKTSQVVGKGAGRDAGAAENAVKEGSGAQVADEKKAKPKRKGHGRNAASAYQGAEKVKVVHEGLKPGDRCPACERGKVYTQSQPAVLVRVSGMAPLQAIVYELQRLRCNLCGEVFTAKGPEGVGRAKHDETAASMIALLKYGCGLPFNRVERLEGDLGIPLPAATQWEVVSQAAVPIEPAYRELVRQAAQGEVIHNDDTTMRILDLEGLPEPDPGKKSQTRTGIFTSGIVSKGAGHEIALFFTGRKHAGENLSDLLAQRSQDLSAPIQMCDGLPVNTSGEFETIVANCIAHARRRFVDVAENFPEECQHVLEELREVYHNDSIAREHNLSPTERLAFHQEQSGPRMDDLKQWLKEQFDQRKVEPNSSLGDAIGYMLEHWERLTLFLHEPGAPLDNNLCERVLKKAILHRKNSMFYKTKNGARVGDLFMSLIHTSELAQANPFDYLVALQRNAKEVSQNPAQWMPWNYREALGRLAKRVAAP
ncbi:MAG: IS66 family transposase [Candidatus Thorarchaeota archaeon]|nr:MAG: IS66 family transposase [Candidatus Thorarchaeota archaeon]